MPFLEWPVGYSLKKSCFFLLNFAFSNVNKESKIQYQYSKRKRQKSNSSDFCPSWGSRAWFAVSSFQGERYISTNQLIILVANVWTSKGDIIHITSIVTLSTCTTVLENGRTLPAGLAHCCRSLRSFRNSGVQMLCPIESFSSAFNPYSWKNSEIRKSSRLL